MRNWSIPIGRLFGVEVRLHLTFLFLLMFVWFTQSTVNGPTLAARGLALVGLVFGSVVLHELAHALVAMRAGIKVRGIVLLPIGGITFMEDQGTHTRQNAARDIRVSAAGPLVNLVIGIAAALGAAVLRDRATGPGCLSLTRPGQTQGEPCRDRISRWPSSRTVNRRRGSSWWPCRLSPHRVSR